MKAEKEEISQEGAINGHDNEAEMPQGEIDQEPIDSRMLTPEWLFTQVALKSLIDNDDIEYARSFAYAALSASNMNGVKFKNKDDVIKYIKNILDQHVADRNLAHEGIKKLQCERESFECEKKEKEEELKIEMHEFAKDQMNLKNEYKAIAVEREALINERGQFQAHLKKENHRLKELSLELETQKADLAIERMRWQINQDIRAATEKQIQAEREKHMQHLLVDQRQAEANEREALINERDQFQAHLKKEHQRLEELRLELENQKTELAKERERWQRNQAAQAADEKQIQAEREKHAQHVLIAQKQAEAMKQMNPCQRVNQRGEEVEKQLSKDKIIQFLTHVYRGNLEYVEKFLIHDKKFASAQGDITDLYGRKFKQVMAFQYAYWAMDIEMCELILRYLPQEEARDQLIVLKVLRSDILKANGSHYSSQAYLVAIKKFLDNYDEWRKNRFNSKSGAKEAMASCWYQEVGSAEREFPAWMIMLMSEEGKDVAWVKRDLNLGFKREDKHLYGWFLTMNTPHHLGAKPDMQNCGNQPEYGSSWARGMASARVGVWQVGEMTRPKLGEPCDFECVSHDYEFISTVMEIRHAAVERLCQRLFGLNDEIARQRLFGSNDELAQHRCNHQ